MGARLLSGSARAAQVRAEVAAEVERLKRGSGVQPGLAVLMVGNHPASVAYVGAKLKACREVGFFSLQETFPEETSEDEVVQRIQALNQRGEIHGILVQLPLSPHLDPDRIMRSVAPEKDVDGFHPLNRGDLVLGKSDLVPCTPMGVIDLLRTHEIPVAGKHAVVVGRSNIVGKPMAALLLAADATVTVCHSRTPDLAAFTRQAEILVLALGQPHSITGTHVREGAVVVDVGFTRENGMIKGDAAPDVAAKASAITPVPGGVGPMTIAVLLRNTLVAAKKLHGVSR